MARLNESRLPESVEIRDLPLAERDGQVALLEDPWIGDEGALDAGFRRGLDGAALRARGLAFDRRTTVVWDEAGVQVLRAAAPRPGVTALQSRVLLRDWLVRPAQLLRVDYLERGCLLGSRYVPVLDGEPGGMKGGMKGDSGHA